MSQFSEHQIRIAAKVINTANQRLFPIEDGLNEAIAGALLAQKAVQSHQHAMQIGNQFVDLLRQQHNDRSKFAPNSKFIRSLILAARA